MALTLAKSLRSDRVGGLRLRDACWVDRSTAIHEVVRLMAERHAGCVLVRDGSRLAGIFTERDFVTRVVAPTLDVSLPIEGVMTPNPQTVPADASVFTAIELMSSGGYRHLPVAGEGGQPYGILSVKELMAYLVEYFPAKVYNLPPTLDQAQPAREGA